MLSKFMDWLQKNKRPILQGAVVLLICMTLLLAFGCNSFSSAGRDSTQSFGLVNTIKGGDGE